MIRELEFTWQVITDDPLLRLELASIEEEENDEQLAELLVGFFGKVDAIVRLGVEILEEDCKTERLEDCKTGRREDCKRAV